MAPTEQPPRPTPPAQRLDVPTLPAPSSRFVLPPPPSDLLSRLQAFLPQIRDANAQLEPRDPALDADGEEPVVVEEITDSSDDDTSDDEDSSSDSDSDAEDSDDADREAGQAARQAVTAPGEAEHGTLAHLMDISARPAAPPKAKLLVQEEPATHAEADARAKADEMHAE